MRNLVSFYATYSSMTEVTYRDRRAVQIENDGIRVTVLVEGGHIAEILHKPSGINPLWTPPWPSIEPSSYDPAKHPSYGADAEARLLAGIMGHNLCLDLFGGPSPEEAAAGITVHGEASVAPYSIRAEGAQMTTSANLKHAQLHFERRLVLDPDGKTVRITETVQNQSAFDRPIAWTQHVTLGPPFLKKGSTQFRAPGTKSKVYDAEFGDGKLKQGADFDWPMAPRIDGTRQDLRVYTDAPASSAYTAHLMDPHRNEAFFLAFSPETKVVFGYRWNRPDFPWLGMWEENMSRKQAPWAGKTVTQGLEFGVSPMPESRRKMIERGSLFGVPAYRWLPARGRAVAQYSAFITTAAKIPDEA
jgi:hypothetical protein